MVPYGRTLVKGKLEVFPEDAATFTRRWSSSASWQPKSREGRPGARATCICSRAWWSEDGLITEEEFASRRRQQAQEGNELAQEIAKVEADLQVRDTSEIVITETLESLPRLRDVYDDLDEVADRRLLLRTCLNRLVIGWTTSHGA